MSDIQAADVYAPEMEEWAWEYAVKEIDRRFDGEDPRCSECSRYMPSFPFYVVESCDGIWCDPCDKKRIHK